MRSLLTKKFPVPVIALMSIMFLACSHDPETTENPSTGHNVVEWQDSVINGDATMTSAPMLFSVSGMTVSREQSTRGTSNVDGDEYTFDSNELITIGITGALRGSGETKDYKVTNTSTGALSYNGTATDGFFWRSTGETMTLRAWSYGNTTKTTSDPDNAVYTLPYDQSSNYGELLYSPAADFDYENYHEGIPITLYHQLARVVINITYDSGSTLTNVRIGDGTSVIPRTAKFHKPTTGNVGTWDDFGSETNQIIPKQETANTCYSAVLIPTTYASGTKFICITIGNETFAYVLDDDMELEAGSQYNYTINIKNRLITFSVTVSAWTNSSSTLNF